MKKKALWSTLMAIALTAVLALSCFASAKTTIPAYLNKKDGNYTVNVTLSGGEADAAVATPTFLRVSKHRGYATIQWENVKYDAMIVDGETIEPTENAEVTTFEIPVMAYDEKTKVTAVAGDKEYEYGMVFASSGIHKVRTVTDYLSTVLVMFLAMVGAVFLTTTQKKGRRR